MSSRTVFRAATRLISRSSPLTATPLTASVQGRWSSVRGVASHVRQSRDARQGHPFLPGDWLCSGCGSHNFGRKDECRCGAHKENFTKINSENLPAPTGPYSHAVKTPFAVFVSGQLPADFQGNLVEGTIRQKAEAVFKNLQQVLVAANSSLDNVFKVQVFLTDMKDYAEMNEVYGEWLPHKPARSCVAVKELPQGVNIEIECIAMPGPTVREFRGPSNSVPSDT
ncbi:endoribonuclease L-PSP [Sclerotinia borealis F-4128]|uniref:Endoribonuclease L-PSP n=1 Tax=Sclerotinia borealis (strain F-4128) TaxID=1432307 RepID=W9CK41_SCLBF|nr:endoribonuclease L-PSP [Sclerotinia borealis F-4128]